ncbi:MAG: transcriptional regulator, partial [Saprospiraceae bacterium]
MAQWEKLESESDYEAAVDRVNIILDADRTDEIQNEIMLLSYLIEEYDAVHYPMPDAAPHEVIKFMLEMKDLKQKDLIPILGTKGNVSKILSGAAKLP